MNWVSLDPGNGLSPSLREAIALANTDLLSNGSPAKKFTFKSKYKSCIQ